MKEVYGINRKAKVGTTWGIIRACTNKYARVGTLVNVVDKYLAILERLNKEEDDWMGAECIFCLELLSDVCSPVGQSVDV
jgi:hypothetical protein